jgi:methyltransferase-like protein
MTDVTPNSYDEVPYPSAPMSQTHPDRLATLGTLFGLSPPRVDRCRVLELACADAGNLLTMAEGLPESQFVGIDLSARHIADGQAALRELGLKNVTLRQQSILDVTPELGLFDYVIAHGVYSWVPAAVQDKILRICHDHLTTHGIAFVSYNTYPGWHQRGVVRDLMRYHTRNVADAGNRAARARDVLALFLETALDGTYRQMLEEEQERIGPTKDSYVFHEHLEEVNEPVYFHEFARRAARHGLQFVAEADRGALAVGRDSPRVREALDRLGDDVVLREQYRDFLTNRTFRQTLLCHQGASLHREPNHERVLGLHVAGRPRPVSERPDVQSAKVEEFRGPSGAIASTGHSISKMAFVQLMEAWPRAVAFDELQATARTRLVGDAVVVQGRDAYLRDTRLLAENVLQAFRAGVLELHAHAPGGVAEPSDRPRALAMARRHAAAGEFVANARQQMVRLDLLSRHLIQALDGTRDRAALVEYMVTAVRQGGLTQERHGRRVEDPDHLRAVLTRELAPNLRRLALSALLVA